MGAGTRRGLSLSNGRLLPSVAPPDNGHQVSYEPPHSPRAGVPIHLSFADGEEGTAEAVDRHKEEARTPGLVLRDLARTSEQSGLALILESEALAVDADDSRVVQDAIEHRGGQHAVAGESAVPTAEGEIRGENHRAAFVASLDDLKEQIGLLAAQRQIADLVDDQQLVSIDRTMHDLAITVLTLRGLQHQHQIGRGKETGLVALLSGEIAERDREMSLAHARRSEEDHVLGALDEGKAGQFHDLLARRAGGEAEVILVKRLDRREAGYPREHFACPRPTRFALGDQ